MTKKSWRKRRKFGRPKGQVAGRGRAIGAAQDDYVRGGRPTEKRHGTMQSFCSVSRSRDHKVLDSLRRAGVGSRTVLRWRCWGRKWLVLAVAMGSIRAVGRLHALAQSLLFFQMARPFTNGKDPKGSRSAGGRLAAAVARGHRCIASIPTQVI